MRGPSGRYRSGKQPERSALRATGGGEAARTESRAPGAVRPGLVAVAGAGLVQGGIRGRAFRARRNDRQEPVGERAYDGEREKIIAHATNVELPVAAILTCVNR